VVRGTFGGSSIHHDSHDNQCIKAFCGKGSSEVQPIGHPINHSTQSGFSRPPTRNESDGSFRVASLGALVSLALCAVGVGHLALDAIEFRDKRIASPSLALLLLPAELAVGVGYSVTNVANPSPAFGEMPFLL
jgi:hypothetical protein